MARWVTLTQPQFLPQLFMMERLARVDLAVIMVDAQFDRYHARVQMSSYPGQDAPIWLSVPIVSVGKQPMNETYLHEPLVWFEKTAKTFKQRYARNVGFKQDGEEFLTWLKATLGESSSLSELGWRCYKHAAWKLGLKTEFTTTVDLIHPKTLKACEWVAAICRKAGTTHYVQGRKSMDSYFIPKLFDGIELYAQDFALPEGIDGSPNYSWVDFWMRHGLEKTKDLIDAGVGVGKAADTVLPWSKAT